MRALVAETTQFLGPAKNCRLLDWAMPTSLRGCERPRLRGFKNKMGAVAFIIRLLTEHNTASVNFKILRNCFRCLNNHLHFSYINIYCVGHSGVGF